jgi:hypothetical protein
MAARRRTNPQWGRLLGGGGGGGRVTRSERGQLLRDRLQISLRPENKQRDEFQKTESGLIHRPGQASVPHRPLCPALSSDRNWTASCHPVRVMDVQSFEGHGLDGRQSTGPSSAMKCIRLELQLVLHHSIYHLRSKLEYNYLCVFHRDTSKLQTEGTKHILELFSRCILYQRCIT